MTTAERLQSVLDSKAAIKAAIIAKGVSCGDTLSDYSNRIAAINSRFVVPDGMVFQGSIGMTKATMDKLDFSNLESAVNLFKAVEWSSTTDTINIALPAATDLTSTFESSQGRGVALSVTCKSLYDPAVYTEMFYDTTLKAVNLTLTTNENPQNLQHTFYGCMAETINLICEGNKIQQFQQTFKACINLVNLHMETQIVADLDLSDCVKLSVDSLVGVIAKLVSGMNKTLTLGATNLAKLTDAQKAVATNKGWTLK